MGNDKVNWNLIFPGIFSTHDSTLWSKLLIGWKNQVWRNYQKIFPHVTIKIKRFHNFAFRKLFTSAKNTSYLTKSFNTNTLIVWVFFFFFIYQKKAKKSNNAATSIDNGLNDDSVILKDVPWHMHYFQLYIGIRNSGLKERSGWKKIYDCLCGRSYFWLSLCVRILF